MMFILRLTVIFEVLKTVLSSGFVLMNLTSSEFVMLKLRRLDSQPLSYKLKGNKSLITLPEGKHRLIEFPLAWNDTLSLGFDVFNAEGGLLISLEMHRRPNPHGSDWQKDVFSAKNARIQAVYRYECDKHFYGEKCEVKCKNSLYLPNVLCNSHGKLDCKKGWTGAKCQIKIDPTHCECKNDGICVCENSNIKEIEQQKRSQENAKMSSHSRRSDGAVPFESSQPIDRTPVSESPDETTKLPLIVIFFLFSIVVVQMIFIFRKCYGQRKPKNLSENGKIQEVFTVFFYFQKLMNFEGSGRKRRRTRREEERVVEIL
ncbi:hypothetical protein WR25_13903 isoform B [Diploscapter pachys]|uniref:Delta-like protein n=1 Tax=Diploscapter pachys TaxID=2018661 RepID=A0A2A2K5C2_9BILA|nr:hypothetical protein WR25_13903 isoform B [Diploscapter pachys]